MPEVVFADPLGSPFRAVSLEEVLQLLQERDEIYWNSPEGPGHGALYYYPSTWTEEAEYRSILVLTKKNTVGYHLVHSTISRSGDEIDHYGGTSTKFTELVWINAAEGKKAVPKELFVPQESAVEAVTSFFNNQSESG